MIEGMIVGAFLGLVGGLIVFIYQWAIKAKKAAAPKVAHLRKTTLPKIERFAAKSSAAISDRVKTKEQKILDIDDKYFKTGSYEIQQNTQVEGLWLKSLALAEGSEEKQKALYIRLRAEQLSAAGEMEAATLKSGLSHTLATRDEAQRLKQEETEAQRIAIREANVKEYMKSYDGRESVGTTLMKVIGYAFAGFMILLFLGGFLAALQK